MEAAVPASPSAAAAASTLAQLRATASHAATARRDPRAAPLPVHKNVSVAETCRFYGAQDAISTCRMPRSCQDCLRMPNCVIAMDGVCRDAGDLSSARDDFHLTLAQYPHGDVYGYNNTLRKSHASHAFYSANATYCSASDAVCSQCRADFQALARSPRTVDALGTQFCVGADGCVCVAVCEAPELLAVRAYDRNCSSDAHAPSYKDPDGIDLAVFSTRRRDPRAPLPSLVHTRQVEDTCAFYGELKSIQGCRQPRSCSDCLQREGCMISLAENEMCTTMESYSTGLDFRSEPPAFPSYVSFPANDTTYCPATDAVCAKCRQGFAVHASNWGELSDNWVHRTNSSFCVGDGGCVCIEQCEKIPDFTVKGCETSFEGPAAEFACAYQSEKDAQGCLQPRNCSDCLQQKSCMVVVYAGVASCTRAENGTQPSDFRLEAKYVATNTALQFPSNATNYCVSTDAVCAKCRENFKETLQPDTEGNLRARYCVGEGGCVCIARCEIPHLFLMDAHDTQCRTASVRPSSESFSILSSAMLGILLIIFWTVWWSRDKQANTEPEPEVVETQATIRGLRRNMLDRAPALHLDLYGWRRYHQQLRAKEHELLAGVEEISPVARPQAFDFADVPTAPDFDEEEASTAPTATNPHALASAPATEQGGQEIDPLVPSAPDFD